MERSIEYSRRLEVRHSVDVLVVGGGPSGVAAAVMCARCAERPLKIMIIEQTGTFGGSSTVALVPELMNFDDGVNFLCGGIGREIHDALFGSEYGGRRWYNVRTEEIKCLYDRLIKDAEVETRFYTHLTDVIVEDNRVRYAVISDPSGTSAVEAKMFIDCTGNASLCSLAGNVCEYGDENGKAMPATLCSVWAGVDFERKTDERSPIVKAYKDGVFSQYDTVLPGIKATFPEVGVGGGNIGHCFEVDDRDADSLTQAMFDGRRILGEFEYYYRNYVVGCERSVLMNTANVLGIRESRRVACVTMLSAEHFDPTHTFDDEIGRYTYPIDIHPMTPDANGMAQFSRDVRKCHNIGESYSIPYRCLVPISLDNVFVAGRCIGADHPMQASSRVIPCCYITGQAAGCAAAVCIEDSATNKTADVEHIRRLLYNNGAYITNIKPDSK